MFSASRAGSRRVPSELKVRRSTTRKLDGSSLLSGINFLARCVRGAQALTASPNSHQAASLATIRGDNKPRASLAISSRGLVH
jgi:hypothetical protein